MSASVPAYDEIAAALASLDPKKVIELRPSMTAQNRLRELLDKNRQGSELTADEKYELDRILALDLLLNLAKGHAQRLLAKATRPKNGHAERLEKMLKFRGDAPFPEMKLSKYDVYEQ